MIMQDPLFRPIVINRLEVKNRISMPAMHLNMCENYEVTGQMEAFYAERAKGGAGLITVGYATVDERSGNPLCLGAHQDDFIPGLTKLAGVIKENSACAMVQINHGGRYVHSRSIDNRQPLAPSAIPSGLTRETPKAMSAKDIGAVIDCFAQAARRVKAAGFDAVEVLSGTGYLISEFLSPATNRRNDGYGGSLPNRMRFGLEVVAAIRAIVGTDFPVVVRMNGNDFMPDGNGREELLSFAKALCKEGVDALNVNVGWHEARVPQITTAVPRGAFAYLARGIRKVVDIPVMAGHRVHDAETARRLIADRMCHMVSMGCAPMGLRQYAPKRRQGRTYRGQIQRPGRLWRGSVPTSHRRRGSRYQS
jgi:2,4-dienoyl-CoA reductase (NADPH2)